MYLGPFVVQVRVGYTFQRHPISGLIDSAGGLLHKTMVWGTAHSTNLITRFSSIGKNIILQKKWFWAQRIPNTL
jgi:hypothetical protein